MTVRGHLRRLWRFARLWPGAYFVWPSRPLSVRMANWVMQDHYLPGIREALNSPCLLFRTPTGPPTGYRGVPRRRVRPIGVRP